MTTTTGDVQSAGGDDHDALLRDAEQALTEHGFSDLLHEQDGRTQLEGTAVNSDYDAAFTIEVETTTPDRPAKVFRTSREPSMPTRHPSSCFGQVHSAGLEHSARELLLVYENVRVNLTVASIEGHAVSVRHGLCDLLTNVLPRRSGGSFDLWVIPRRAVFQPALVAPSPSKILIDLERVFTRFPLAVGFFPRHCGSGGSGPRFSRYVLSVVLHRLQNALTDVLGVRMATAVNLLPDGRRFRLVEFHPDDDFATPLLDVAHHVHVEAAIACLLLIE